MAESLKRKIFRRLPAPWRERVEAFRYRGLPEPLRTVRPHSMLSLINLVTLQELARRLDMAKTAGDFVECGVYRGGSAGVLGDALMNSPIPRRLWLYDSFEGMPKASEKDDAHSHAIESQYVGSEEQARRILHKLRVAEDKFTIVRGRFEKTFGSVKPTPVALLHVDCDFYEPVKLTLETFYPLVVAGGFVIFNDYGSFQGCRTAADEFMSANSIKAPLIQIDQDAYYFQKP
jgi:O-methyltransferase